MLKVLTKDGFSQAKVLPLFQNLITRRRLIDCKWAIMNVDDPPSFWGCHWTRFLLLEFECRPIYTSNGSCKGYGRTPHPRLLALLWNNWWVLKTRFLSFLLLPLHHLSSLGTVEKRCQITKNRCHREKGTIFRRFLCNRCLLSKGTVFMRLWAHFSEASPKS